MIPCVIVTSGDYKDVETYLSAAIKTVETMRKSKTKSTLLHYLEEAWDVLHHRDDIGI